MNETPLVIVTSDAVTKGGVSVVLLHCVFNGNGSITHWLEDNDRDLVTKFPHLSVVLLARKGRFGKEILGGMVVKSTYTTSDPDYVDALEMAVMNRAALAKLPKESFLPAKIALDGNALPNEHEMLSILVSQATKHGTAGNA